MAGFAGTRGTGDAVIARHAGTGSGSGSGSSTYTAAAMQAVTPVCDSGVGRAGSCRHACCGNGGGGDTGLRSGDRVARPSSTANRTDASRSSRGIPTRGAAREHKLFPEVGGQQGYNKGRWRTGLIDCRWLGLAG